MEQGTCNLCGEACNNIIIDHTNCCICRNIRLELMCDVCSSEIKRDMEELERGKLNNVTGEIIDDKLVTEENKSRSAFDEIFSKLNNGTAETIDDTLVTEENKSVSRDLVKYKLSDMYVEDPSTLRSQAVYTIHQDFQGYQINDDVGRKVISCSGGTTLFGYLYVMGLFILGFCIVAELDTIIDPMYVNIRTFLAVIIVLLFNFGCLRFVERYNIVANTKLSFFDDEKESFIGQAWRWGVFQKNTWKIFDLERKFLMKLRFKRKKFIIETPTVTYRGTIKRKGKNAWYNPISLIQVYNSNQELCYSIKVKSEQFREGSVFLVKFLYFSRDFKIAFTGIMDPNLAMLSIIPILHKYFPTRKYIPPIDNQ